MSSASCCTAATECKFVISIIDSLQKMLAFMNPGKFGGGVYTPMIFQSRADQKETITLDDDGFMIYIYVKAFNESFPTEEPTPEQIERINAIWDALNKPERKIAL
jgi:hypothetical protein